MQFDADGGIIYYCENYPIVKHLANLKKYTQNNVLSRRGSN
jgi:hypothetical protein